MEDAGPLWALVEYVRMLLEGSWFTTGARQGVFQHTSTGTVPGTPTADVMFQLAQSVFLKNLNGKLEDRGLTVRVRAGGEVAPTPAWADDVVVCTPCCAALELMPLLATLIQEVEEASREIGVRLNFDVI